jgi:hypothetical protein
MVRSRARYEPGYKPTSGERESSRHEGTSHVDVVFYLIDSLCQRNTPYLPVLMIVISQLLAGLNRRGPVRVFKWTVALFYPTCVVVTNGIVRLWKSLVAKENRKVQLPSNKAAIV